MSLFLFQVKSDNFQQNTHQSINNSNKKGFKNINKNTFAFKSKFNNYLKRDIYDSGSKILNLLLSQNNESKDFVLDIESDIQYFEENIFYAESNVILYISNGILEADKVSYDKENKLFKASGNLKFYKGKQFFEATELVYDLGKNEGYIDNVYGLLDLETINEDFELKNIRDNSEDFSYEEEVVEEFVYVNTSSLGIVNDYENIQLGKFRPKDFSIDIPSFSKLRFKSKRFILKSKMLKSELVLFSNDPLNKPQFILESRNFTAQIVKDKTQLISKNTWIVFDDIFKFPIGKRNIIDRDPISSWGIGSDFVEKDGWYFVRKYEKVSLSNDFFIQLTPNILFQRAIKDSTKAFREDGSSIFSPRVKKHNIDITDFFALDYELVGDINDWKLISTGSLISLNPERLNESLRYKIVLKTNIDLQSKEKNKNKKLKDSQFININNKQKRDNSQLKGKQSIDIKNNNLSNISLLIENQPMDIIDNEKSFGNYLDLQIYNTFKEKVSKGYAGDAEIYFGTGLTISNRKLWSGENFNSRLSLIYDLGHFNAKDKNANHLNQLFRNVFAFEFDNKLKIWKSNNIKNNLAENFKYTPSPILPSLYWATNVQSGAFYYGNGASQKSIGLNIGPELKFGNRTKNFLDYTVINLKKSFVLTDGESPFAFDNVSSSERFNYNLKQQILGPLIFGYYSSLNLRNGKSEKPKYTFDITRRAYSIGAFYDMSAKTIGIQFNVFNFLYDGRSTSF